jgi:hypothetical protein
VNEVRLTMDLAERRVADRTLAQRRQEARRDYVRYSEQEADADREYEKTRARVFAKSKSEGLSDKAAELACRSAAADHKHRRDIAHSLAKASLLRIEESEREAVTVRDLHSSSERVDGLAA